MQGLANESRTDQARTDLDNHQERNTIVVGINHYLRKFEGAYEHTEIKRNTNFTIKALIGPAPRSAQRMLRSLYFDKRKKQAEFVALCVDHVGSAGVAYTKTSRFTTT